MKQAHGNEMDKHVEWKSLSIMQCPAYILLAQVWQPSQNNGCVCGIRDQRIHQEARTFRQQDIQCACGRKD
jgi:hypothetical protein